MSAFNRIEEIVRNTATDYLDEHWTWATDPHQIAAELLAEHRAEVLAEVAAEMDAHCEKYGVLGVGDRLRRMAGEQSSREADATPFFQPGHTYAREHHGRTIQFHVRYIDTAPDCDFPTAFGFRKDPEIDVMLPMDADDFHGCGWIDVTEAGGPDA